MTITTLSSREFQQNANRAQKATRNGPVFITNRGRPAHVLLSYDEYQRITGKRRNIVEALSMPGLEDIELENPPFAGTAAPGRFLLMFLLDTNVISELRKAGGGKADPNVVSWLSTRDATTFYISAVTLMELDLGILLIERRDPAQGARLRAWVDDYVIPEFSERTVPVDRAVAFRCARLHVPDPRPERDAFIAASALVHGMTIVTRNVADFEPMGVAVINPWNHDH